MSAAGPRLLTERRAGVLLHPTSLIGSDASGALGRAARTFIDWLSQARFSVWQVLPLGPPGADGSPYWARSDYAGNPALIDRSELPDSDAQRADFDAFRETNRAWLEDYVLYETLSRRFASAWWDWPAPLRAHEAGALAEFTRSADPELEQCRREQWYFDWQWRALRRYAAERGVALFGDLPIYTAPDSVATWAQPAQFQLTSAGRPALLAGVPPDYFSADGQLWGNPLYDWAQAQRDHFAFWRLRLGRALSRFDLVRIDHFRGLSAYWAVPAGAATAREGHWSTAPGHELFRTLQADFPDLPLVAEDLGIITPDVTELRRAFGLPGMRVLQFGFDGSPDNPHLPHNYQRDVVAYTGTHDNDTTAGWSASLAHEVGARVAAYLGAEVEEIPPAMARAVLASVATLAIVPAQDLLQLGSAARFNTPGTVRGNWSWRLPMASLNADIVTRYAAWNGLYGRVRERLYQQ